MLEKIKDSNLQEWGIILKGDFVYTEKVCPEK